MIETRAPGKLFIVGEYAVVEAGEPAVLVSVDRLLHVRLTERDAPVACGASEHVLAAIRAVDELRAHRGLPERHFEIETESELEDERGRKFGLGSSAAVTVAVVEALDRLHGLGLDPVERFRLALLATIEVSPRASGGDLASSTFGGWILYRSPDRAELRAHRAAHGIASALVCDAWRRCEVRRLPAPRDLELLVGWTGSPASTRQLVDGVSPQQPAAPLDQPAFLAASRDCVEALAGALERGGGGADALRAIREARGLLRRLGDARGIEIETEMLRDLCDIAERRGAAAKPSGAGGGDCGIALAPSGSDIQGILREWEHRGIRRLQLGVHAAPVFAEGGADER